MAEIVKLKSGLGFDRRDRATIITQTPMRLTMAGGGTDVLWYSRLRGGAWISAAINKYVFIFLNQTEDPNIIKASHGVEATISTNYKEIPNPIIRECLRQTKITRGVEIATAADASAKSGLGGSGAFEVGLLHALFAYRRQSISQVRLGKLAADVEIKRLKRPVGPQDQYIAAIGGINFFDMDKNGNISIEPLKLSIDAIAKLESNMLYFRTDILRDASEVLQDQKDRAEKTNFRKVAENLDEIKALGLRAKRYLLTDRIDDYGQTLHEHWQIKRRLSSKVSSPKIDEWYNDAIKAGAVGGKIIGAGGGGWFVFYVPENKGAFRRRMAKIGLEERRVRFDWEGTKVLINLS